MPKHARIVVISRRQIDKASFTPCLPHNFVSLFCAHEAVSYVITKHRSIGADRALFRGKETNVVRSADFHTQSLADVWILELLDKASHVVQNRNHPGRQHATVSIAYRTCQFCYFCDLFLGGKTSSDSPLYVSIELRLSHLVKMETHLEHSYLLLDNMFMILIPL
jgi:hypothetical protein